MLSQFHLKNSTQFLKFKEYFLDYLIQEIRVKLKQDQTDFLNLVPSLFLAFSMLFDSELSLFFEYYFYYFLQPEQVKKLKEFYQINNYEGVEYISNLMITKEFIKELSISAIVSSKYKYVDKVNKYFKDAIPHIIYDYIYLHCFDVFLSREENDRFKELEKHLKF